MQDQPPTLLASVLMATNKRAAISPLDDQPHAKKLKEDLHALVASAAAAATSSPPVNDDELVEDKVKLPNGSMATYLAVGGCRCFDVLEEKTNHIWRCCSLDCQNESKQWKRLIPANFEPSPYGKGMRGFLTCCRECHQKTDADDVETKDNTLFVLPNGSMAKLLHSNGNFQDAEELDTCLLWRHCGSSFCQSDPKAWKILSTENFHTDRRRPDRPFKGICKECIQKSRRSKRLAAHDDEEYVDVAQVSGSGGGGGGGDDDDDDDGDDDQVPEKIQLKDGTEILITPQKNPRAIYRDGIHSVTGLKMRKCGYLCKDKEKWKPLNLENFGAGPKGIGFRTVCRECNRQGWHDMQAKKKKPKQQQKTETKEPEERDDDGDVEMQSNDANDKMNDSGYSDLVQRETERINSLKTEEHKRIQHLNEMIKRLNKSQQDLELEQKKRADLEAKLKDQLDKLK
jgi:hypothetical protein